jgi:hypothetical protein
MRYLTQVAGTLIDRSKETSHNLSGAQRTYPSLDISFLYAHLDPEQNNHVGIIIPAPAIAPENGARYLTERLKAVVLEILLFAQAEEYYGISKIAMHDSRGLAVFSVLFDYLSPTSEHKGLTKTYDNTNELDTLFQEALEHDGVFSNAGIRYVRTNGAVLDYIDLGRSGPEAEEETIDRPKPSKEDIEGYVDQETAIDLLFGLQKSGRGYRRRHAVAQETFTDSIASGAWADSFGNFDEKMVGNEMFYSRKSIEKVITGDEETTERSDGEIVSVRRHYVVHVSDDMVVARIFPFGAFEHEDVIQYYGFSDGELKGNFADEELGKIKKFDRIVVDDHEGQTRVLYASEDLDELKRRKQSKSKKAKEKRAKER